MYAVRLASWRDGEYATKSYHDGPWCLPPQRAGPDNMSRVMNISGLTVILSGRVPLG